VHIIIPIWLLWTLGITVAAILLVGIGAVIGAVVFSNQVMKAFWR
jgi:hypothetical protein